MDALAYKKQLASQPIPKELPFTREEYQQRMDKVKKEMDRAGLDVLLVTHIPNLYYLTGFYTFSVGLFSCLILPREGKPSVYAASLEVTATLLCSWIEEMETFDWHQTGEIGSGLARVLKARGLDKKRIGIEPRRSGLSAAIYEQVKSGLPQAKIVNGSDIVAKARIIKSPKEIEYLREAGKITIAGVKAGLGAVKAGVTDNQVARAVYDAMVGAGSEFFSTGPVVTAGHRFGWVHTNHRRVPLKAGDTVFIELGGCYQRYTAPMMRTAVIGQPSDQVKRVTEAVKATFNRIVEAARPGRTCHEVAVEAKKGYASIDSEVFFSGVFGYNVGVGFPPDWAEGITHIAEGIDQPLEPGMTFHLPTCLRVPGKLGVGLSETIAITQKGCEILTEKDRDIHIAPA